MTGKSLDRLYCAEKLSAGEPCPRYVLKRLTKLMGVGWFYDRDGTVLCPDHLPAELAQFMGGAPNG